MGQALKTDRTPGGRNAILLHAHDALASLTALIIQAIRDGDDRQALALHEVLQQVEVIAENAARLPFSGPMAGGGIEVTLRP